MLLSPSTPAVTGVEVFTIVTYVNVDFFFRHVTDCNSLPFMLLPDGQIRVNMDGTIKYIIHVVWIEKCARYGSEVCTEVDSNCTCSLI